MAQRRQSLLEIFIDPAGEPKAHRHVLRQSRPRVFCPLLTAKRGHRAELLAERHLSLLLVTIPTLSRFANLKLVTEIAPITSDNIVSAH